MVRIKRLAGPNWFVYLAFYENVWLLCHSYLSLRLGLEYFLCGMKDPENWKGCSGQCFSISSKIENEKMLITSPRSCDGVALIIHYERY